MTAPVVRGACGKAQRILMMSETSRIRVNLSAVEHNVRILRGIVGSQCVLCPIIKADGYGLGAAPIARHLKAAGAEMLAVYTPAQAAEGLLRNYPFVPSEEDVTQIRQQI